MDFQICRILLTIRGLNLIFVEVLGCFPNLNMLGRSRDLLAVHGDGLVDWIGLDALASRVSGSPLEEHSLSDATVYWLTW